MWNPLVDKVAKAVYICTSESYSLWWECQNSLHIFVIADSGLVVNCSL